MNTTRKLLLNSKGFETKQGVTQIQLKLGELGIGDLAHKSIFVVSNPAYEVDERIVANLVDILGIKIENIYLSKDGLPQNDIVPDIVYVTAGNTFEVLQYMRDYGLIKYIRRLFQKCDSLIYIGSSAGAIIAGTDIFFSKDFDSNFVGMEDFRALGLFDGAIIPHYEPEELERYKADKEESVLAKYPVIYSVSNDEVLVLDAKPKRKHKLYVTGDTHAEHGRFEYPGYAYNRDLQEGDILFCCGDFGYLFDDSFGERLFMRYLAEEKPYTICWVDGNHENFDLLNTYPVEILNGGKVHVIGRDKSGEPKVIHLMRGQVYEIYDHKLYTFGGAYSIDKYNRSPGISWWEQEMPTDAEMAEGNRNLEKHNYEVDYILTHTAPEKTMSLFFPEHEHEKRLNNYLEYVRENVKYKHWYMGHLHREEDLSRNQTILWFSVRDMLTNEVLEED